MDLSRHKTLGFRVAQAVRDHETASRAEIARYLDVSPATVGRVADRLLSAGVLREIGPRPAKAAAAATGAAATTGVAGRPSKLLQFNPYIGSVLTIDLRETDVRAAITDFDGRVLVRLARPLTGGDTARSLAELLDLVRDLLAAPRSGPAVTSIVVGAPSIVDAEMGVVEWAPSLGWRGVALQQLLAGEFGLDVLVENDVNLAAAGEYWKGAGRTVRHNLVFISVGSGVGAGIILNGELYRGATNAAGEIAYFITDVNVLRDNMGQIGNLENRIGRAGLVRLAQLVAHRYPASQLSAMLNRSEDCVDTASILALAENGDPAAQIVYRELVNILTIVICNASLVLDPEMVIVGGPDHWNWTNLITAIQAQIGSALLRPVHLAPSELGSDALIMGGAYAALGSLGALLD